MLSKRLQKVLDYINVEDKLADIGCDHGYLSLYAIKKGVKFVQLVDNKIGPLNVAKKNLSKEKLDAEIKYSLSSGLSDIDGKVDTVAICGMGGDLISKILYEDIDTAKKMKYLILEANSKVDVLREFLSSNCFEIMDEDVVFEKDKYYEILIIRFNSNIEQLTKTEIEFGPVLLKKKNDIFKEYLMDKLNKLNLIVNKNNESKEKLIVKIDKINAILESFKNSN